MHIAPNPASSAPMTDPSEAEAIEALADEPVGGESQNEPSPAERRRKRVRDAILGAAERVFAHEGASGLSIRRLAEAVDYSPAAIYKYFPSKAAVISALKESFFEKLTLKMEAAETMADDVRVDLRRSFLIYVETGLAHPNHYAAAFSSTDGEVAEAREEDYHHRDKAYEFLCSLVAQGVATGALKRLDPACASLSLWASMHGLVMLMIALPGFPTFDDMTPESSRTEFIAFHADMVLSGLYA